MTDLEKEIKCLSEIPKINGIYTNWVKQTIVVWKPKQDIIQVHRLLVYELPDNRGNWTGVFNFSEQAHGFNKGQWRSGYGYPDYEPEIYYKRLHFWEAYPKTIEINVIQDRPLVRMTSDMNYETYKNRIGQ